MACVVIPRLADKYGRKRIIILGCIVQTIAFTTMLSISSQYVYYLMLFLVGLTSPMKGIVAYSHLMEWVHGKEAYISSIIFFYDGFIFVICTLVLLFITKNTMSLVWIGLILNIIPLVIFLILFFPESPRYLLNKEKFKEF